MLYRVLSVFQTSRTSRGSFVVVQLPRIPAVRRIGLECRTASASRNFSGNVVIRITNSRSHLHRLCTRYENVIHEFVNARMWISKFKFL